MIHNTYIWVFFYDILWAKYYKSRVFPHAIDKKKHYYIVSLFFLPHRAIKYFEDSVEIMRMSIISESYKEQLTACLDSITERTQDFTDSAYTSHEHRQNIIMLCDRAKIELVHLLR